MFWEPKEHVFQSMAPKEHALKNMYQNRLVTQYHNYFIDVASQLLYFLCDLSFLMNVDINNNLEIHFHELVC